MEISQTDANRICIPTEFNLGRRDAQRVLGTTDLKCFEKEFHFVGDWTVSGSATVQAGGFVRFTVPNNNSVLLLADGGAATVDNPQVSSVATSKWYLRTRLRFGQAAVDAQEYAVIAFPYQVPASFLSVNAGVIGSSFVGGSDTHFCLQKMDHGGGKTAGITSTVAVDQAWHVFRVYSSGTRFYFSVDTEPFQSCSNANVNADPAYVGFVYYQNAGGGNRTCDWDYVQCLWEAP